MRCKLLIPAVLAATMVVGVFTAHAGWKSEGSNWFFYSDGEKRWLTSEWLYDDTKDRYYYFGEDSVMQTGWVTIDGYSYYLEADDANTRGAMYANTTTPDGSIVGADGVKVANPNEKFIQN